MNIITLENIFTVLGLIAIGFVLGCWVNQWCNDMSAGRTHFYASRSNDSKDCQAGEATSSERRHERNGL